MNVELFVARRYLRSRRRENFISIITVISVGGVALGVAALILTLSMMNGFEKEVRSRIVGTTAAITVFEAGGGAVLGWENLAAQTQAVPGIRGVSPFVMAKTAIRSERQSDGVVVRGILPEREIQTSDIADRLRRGVFDVTSSPGDSLPGALLGATLAQHLGVGLGDPVVIYGGGRYQGRLGQTPRVMKFEVAGIFESGMYEYDASLVLVGLEPAQTLFELGPGVTGLHASVDDLFGADAIARRTNAALGPGYLVTHWKETHKDLFSWMALEKYAMFLALSLIVAVAAFNIIATLIMIIMEKRTEIGIMKSFGMTTRSVRLVFLYQGGIVGLVGTALGCLLGYLGCWLQSTFEIIRLPSEIYFISALPVDPRWSDFTAVAVAAVGLCLLAAVYPASRAARLFPVRALQYGG
jgi:lipoprotein-releasing system permease protein